MSDSKGEAWPEPAALHPRSGHHEEVLYLLHVQPTNKTIIFLYIENLSQDCISFYFMLTFCTLPVCEVNFPTEGSIKSYLVLSSCTFTLDSFLSFLTDFLFLYLPTQSFLSHIIFSLSILTALYSPWWPSPALVGPGNRYWAVILARGALSLWSVPLGCGVWPLKPPDDTCILSPFCWSPLTS